MCGLVGVVGPNGGDREVLSRMRDSLAHRGPDDVGLYLDEHVGLGFRRLSIIDVQTGHQPLSNETGSVWVVLNGEIYNFRSLRRELESKGHQFATESDTECIVHGYEEYGCEVFSKLNGMFAIAIWDRQSRRLVLGRDRAGEKPLHYCIGPRGLVFGSEIKALLQHPTVSREIDRGALDEYLSFGYIAAPRSIFRDIRKLLPGHYLIYEHDRLQVHRFWHIDLQRQYRGTFEEAREECLGLLDDAVRLRMVSDVPLGAFLSGGIDSSAVVAFMARNSSQPVRTFSIGFPESGYDETRFAELVARQYGTEHTKLVVTPDYQHHIEEILLNFDEPFGDSSALPTYLVSSLTRRHVTVALSGDGGDELFGGYITYRMLLRFARMMRFLPGSVWPLVARGAHLLPSGSKVERRLRFVGMSEDDRFVRMVTHFRASDKDELYAPEMKDLVKENGVSLQQVAHFAETGRHYSERMQYSDFMHYLPDDILVKVDRTSMLVSLEARAPFLDHRFVEFAFSLPAAWKISTKRSKVILREALKAILPTEILAREKWGFSVPLKDWLAGPLYEYCRSRITDGALSRLFTPKAVDKLLQQHHSRKRDNSSKLWLLLCLALWSRKYGNGQ